MVQPSATCNHFPRWQAGKEIEYFFAFQDFIVDYPNPNIDGLLNNVKQSYQPVTDQYGNWFITATVWCFGI